MKRMRIVVVGDPAEEVYEAVVSPCEALDGELVEQAVERLNQSGLCGDHQFVVECEAPPYRPVVRGEARVTPPAGEE